MAYSGVKWPPDAMPPRAGRGHSGRRGGFSSRRSPCARGTRRGAWRRPRAAAKGGEAEHGGGDRRALQKRMVSGVSRSTSHREKLVSTALDLPGPQRESAAARTDSQTWPAISDGLLLGTLRVTRPDTQTRRAEISAVAGKPHLQVWISQNVPSSSQHKGLTSTTFGLRRQRLRNPTRESNAR